MIRTVITILFSMYLGHSFAQGTFFYQHDTKDYSNEPRAIVELDDSYIIAGFSDGGWAATDLFLMKIDKGGNFLWDKIIDKEQIEEYNAIIDIGDGILAGGRRWINQDSRNLLTKFDYDGNVIWDKLIGDTATLAFDNVIRDLFKTEDGILVATSGFGTSTNTTDAMLMKIDFEGNILWKKLYNSDYNEQRIDYLEKITKTDDGYLLKMHSENQALELFPHIIKVDEQGNEIWRKEFHYYQSTIKPTLNSDTSIVFTDLALLDNNTILTSFTKRDTVIPTYMGELVFIEFDLTTGNEVAYHEVKSDFYLENRIQLFVNQNGEIIITGYCAPNNTSINHGSELYFGKFSKDYEVITEKHYGDTAANEIDHAAMITSDGGSLIAGHYFNPNIGNAHPPQFNTILYKTDCMGNLQWDNTACPIPEEDNLAFNVYPNPHQNQFKIEIPRSKSEGQVNFRLYNITGKKVKDIQYQNQQTLNISTYNLAKGLYIYQIILDNNEYKTGKIIKQ